jgi:glycosyltransferase involved in cell wall biosynthesis
MHQLKVVISVPLGQRFGGAENMLWTFLCHIDRTRIEPIVVFLEHGPFERDVASLGIRTTAIPAGRLRQPWRANRAIISLARFFRSEQPDLILNWMAKSQLYGGIAASLASMSDRVVWWQHGVPDGHWLDRLATLLPARAVGCSSLASAHAQERVWPHRSTFVVHPGAESAAPSSEERSALRRQLSIPKGATVLGIVGRLQPWKGQHRFIEALGKLRSSGHDVHGLIIGGNAYDLSPGYERELTRLVTELGLEQNVTFTGHVPDARPYVSLMDVLVNASDPEPFGIVLVEAMALGVPVVAVDSGGPAEIVEHEQSGLLVNSGDPRTLADAVERVVLDEELRRRLSRGGRERYTERFTAGKMAASLQEKLEELQP